MSTVGIGSPVWIFDSNHRVYPPREKGGLSSGPIWREHWVKRKIVAETSRSWITDYWGRKIPKKGADPRVIAFSEEEITRAAWVHDNAHKIARVVGVSNDFEQLQAIAKLIGYQEANP